MYLTIKNLNKSYGDKQVLCDFSAAFPLGKTSVIMGPSGCGKTTLLNILLGFLSPDSGEITGRPDTVSAVFQEDRLCEDFSALSNVTMVKKERNVSEASRLLTALGLEDAIHKKVRELSGGMKRRVAIARALYYGGDLLILDEALKGLDENTKQTVLQVIRQETAGKTVIAVTHDEEEASFLSDTIIRMEAQA